MGYLIYFQHSKVFVIPRGYPTVWSLGSWGSWGSGKISKKQIVVTIVLFIGSSIFIYCYRIFRKPVFGTWHVSTHRNKCPKHFLSRNNFQQLWENFWKHFLPDKLLKIRFWTSLKTTFLLNILETNFSKGVLNLPSRTKTQEAFWNNFHWRHVFSRVASETYGLRGTGWCFGTFFFLHILGIS